MSRARVGSPDLHQAKTRLFVSMLVLAYVGYFALRGEDWIRGHEWLFLLTAAAYLAIALVLMKMARGDRRAGLPRRSIGLAADTIAPTVALALMNDLGATLFWMHLFVTSGHGARYGNSYLFVAQALSLIGLVIVYFVNPFWPAHQEIWNGAFLATAILPFYIASIGRNLQRSRDREHELREAAECARESADAANRAKSSFLATMTHELRTPLFGVIGSLELALDRLRSSDEREHLLRADESARKMLALVNDILDVSKAEAGRIELESVRFDVHATVLATLRSIAPIARAKGIALRTRLDARLPCEAIGSPGALTRVIDNLVGNAVKFTPSGAVTVRLHAARGRLRVEVADTGVGIPPEALARVFEPFFQVDQRITREFGGTGLGTTIARQFVELMGGTIGVESTAGAGSTFWFEIPLAAAPAPPIEDAPIDAHGVRLWLSASLPESIARVVSDAIGWGAALNVGAGALAPAVSARETMIAIVDAADLVAIDPRLGGAVHWLVVGADACAVEALEHVIAAPVLDRAALYRAIHAATLWLPPERARERISAAGRTLQILLCDDSEINRFLMRAALMRAGHRVTAAADGDAALEALAGARFDLAIVDWHMPGRDGLEVLRAYRQTEPDGERLPFIMHTADVTARVHEECEAAGFAAILPKPVDLALVLETVERVAGRAGRAKALALEAKPADRLVDSARLAELARFAADPDFIEPLLASFIRDARGLLETIECAAEVGDAPALERALHTLRGNCGNVGARALYELCATPLAGRLPDFRRAFDATVVELERLRREWRAARV